MPGPELFLQREQEWIGLVAGHRLTYRIPAVSNASAPDTDYVLRAFIVDIKRCPSVLIRYGEYITVDDNDVAEHVVVNIAAKRDNTVDIENHGVGGLTLI